MGGWCLVPEGDGAWSQGVWSGGVPGPGGEGSGPERVGACLVSGVPGPGGGVETPPKATAAGGMHPTGIHSSYFVSSKYIHRKYKLN